MDAVILDVGGVFLVPHFETVAAALQPFGIVFDEDGAQRAHYFGVRALDAAEQEQLDERQAYMTGYAEGAGVRADQREAALLRIREVWLKASTGGRVAEWEGEIAADSYRVRRLIARWLEEGALQPA